MKPQKIGVLGGGSWGATLAARLAANGHDVAIWEYSAEVADYLLKNRSLKTIPQLILPEKVLVTNDLPKALAGRPIVLSVTPSHTVRATLKKAVESGALQKGAVVISASKGLENGTHMRMTQVIADVCRNIQATVALSGPSHAEEVALGQPVALVAASNDLEEAKKVQGLFSADTFRIYTSDDPIGAELGGALKNIYAVACGVTDGLHLGDNTKAALISRGLLEITRLGKALGAKPITFFGLSGLGDLIVTSGSKHSRNRRLGELIGGGKTLDQALAGMTMVSEGVLTLKAAHDLAKSKGVEVPIINEMHRVLYENKSPHASIRDLMSRQVGAEMEGIVL